MSILSNPILLLSMPGGMEWLWIVLIVFLLFGAKKIPELARGLGSGIHNFNEAKTGKDDGRHQASDASSSAEAV